MENEPKLPVQDGEEDKKQPEAGKPALSNTDRGKKTLFVYGIVFAVVAIALIAISYIVQVKENRELEGHLKEQTTIAEGAAENIKKLQSEYEKLSDEKAGLEKTLEESKIASKQLGEELDAAKAALTEAQVASESYSKALLESDKRLSAYSNMTELYRLSLAGDKEGMKAIIAIMEQKGEGALLNETTAADYTLMKNSVEN